MVGQGSFRKLSSHIFNVNAFKSYTNDVFCQEAKLVIDYLSTAADSGKVLDLQKIFYLFTLSSFGEIAFDQTFGCLKNLEQEVELSVAFDRLNNALSERIVSPIWKIRDWNHNDLMQLFMDARDENDKPLSDEINTILAGHDTTTQALSWMFCAMHRSNASPDILFQITEETDSILEGKLHTYESIKQQKCAEAFFLETLRLYPSVPQNLKQSVQDDVLPGGVSVYKGESTRSMEHALACEKVFAIPELLVLIRAHLTKRDLSRLMSVSKNFNDIFFPVFYNDVNLLRCSYIFSRYVATQSLILSAPHIRKVTMDDEFLAMYSKGVVAFMDNSTTAVNHNRLHLTHTIPLPPMELLSGLTYVPSPGPQLETRTKYRQRGMNFMRLCWAIELSPLLTQLSAGDLFLGNSHEPGALTRVIGGLVHLRKLELLVQGSEVLWTRLLVGIARHCPAMVQEIRLAWARKDCNYLNVLKLDQLDTTDEEESRLPLPQEPLRYLTKLDLEEGYYYLFRDIYPLLARCPYLTTLSPPPCGYPEDRTLIVTYVSQHCPKLRRVYRRATNREVNGTTTLGAILGALPRNSLHHLSVNHQNRCGSNICRTIPNHYESLMSIKFPGCVGLDSAVILGILLNCPSVEEFEVQGFEGHLWQVSITMEDAGEEPWASGRIRVLELAIDMGDINELYYPIPPEEPSGRQMARMKQLETFYKRIAAQHRLTNLCLKIAHTPADRTRKASTIAILSSRQCWTWNLLRMHQNRHMEDQGGVHHFLQHRMKSRPVGSRPDAMRHPGDIQDSELLEPAYQAESALEQKLQTVVSLEQAQVWSFSQWTPRDNSSKVVIEPKI
ncbi:Protein kinase alk2 [Linnemannia hyalina]|uniref:Protein kinase alk2 n=1 Tax=Linnemannia hyalina TaxID=64524 RepID=A0A9P7XS40_9FUNG|nr:Protein kinase alk2 [Linnemannia hyalina]